MATMKMFRERVKVKIRGEVPFDMMRYDNCVPDTEGDAHKLERIAEDMASAEDREVTFRRYSANDGGPTTRRWQSFCCDILSVEPIT